MKTSYTICVLFFVLFASLESKAIQTTTEQPTISSSEFLPADEFTSAVYSKSENSINLVYHLSSNSDTRIRVYEITGKIVKDIHLPVQSSGTYNESIDRDFLKEGIYIVELNIAGKRFTRRIVIS